MKKNSVIVLVREEIRRQVMGETLKPINESLDWSLLLENHSAEINATVLEEGIGSGILKAVGVVSGGFLGADIIGTAGMAVAGGIGFVLASVGLVSSSAILPMVVVGGLTGWVYGLFVGGEFGLNLARRVTMKGHEKISSDLIDATNKRDLEIKKLASGKVKNPESVKNKIDKLTNKQQKAADRLLKEIEFSKEQGFITITDYEALKKLCKVAKQGKLTYLGNKR